MSKTISISRNSPILTKRQQALVVQTVIVFCRSWLSAQGRFTRMQFTKLGFAHLPASPFSTKYKHLYMKQ